MERIAYIIAVVVGVPVLTIMYYTTPFGEQPDKVILTISTFLFSIFTGFFISRQAARFNRIRENVTSFDGKLSSIYRLSGHISNELQTVVGSTIQKHYEKIFSTKKWNIHFQNKSTTLSQLHVLLDTHVKDDDITKLRNQALGAIVKALGACQAIRKQIVALYEERIPREQWVLIIFFAVMLIATASSLTSTGEWFVATLKAAFVVSILSVIYILFKLNRLAYSEQIMGEHSAHDVIDIIEGTK